MVRLVIGLSGMYCRLFLLIVMIFVFMLLRVIMLLMVLFRLCICMFSLCICVILFMCFGWVVLSIVD